MTKEVCRKKMIVTVGLSFSESGGGRWHDIHASRLRIYGGSRLPPYISGFYRALVLQTMSLLHRYHTVRCNGLRHMLSVSTRRGTNYSCGSERLRVFSGQSIVFFSIVLSTDTVMTALDKVRWVRTASPFVFSKDQMQGHKWLCFFYEHFNS